MKTFTKSALTIAVTAGLLTLASIAQTASGTASGNANASVSPGQTNANAGANANQSVQAPGASANTNANANANASAQASHEPKAKPESNAKSGSAKSSNSSSSSSSGSGNASAALSSGTNLQAELTKPLDAKKAKPGDEVDAKVTHDVKSDGKVVVHKGTRLVGHVTEAQARTKDQANSTLGIAFDKAVLKSGEEVAFSSVIQAIAPPVQATAATAADENIGIGGTPAAPSSGGGAPRATGGGSLVGGVTSTAGTTVSGATGAVGGTVNSATNATVGGATHAVGGLTAQGNLTSTAQGAVGMQGLVLNTPAAVTGSAQGSAQGSVISSASRNVRLESGTQMLLRVTGSAQ